MGLVKRSRIKRRRSILETKGELDIEGLQQWQRDILTMEDSKDYLNTAWLSICDALERDKEIPLTKTQMKMLEEILRGDWIEDDKVRGILEAVFELGFYYERDRKILNDWRRKYLSERKG